VLYFAITTVAQNDLNLFVSTLSGKTISLQITMSHTVSMLKEMVERKVDIPYKEQRLVYGTKQLDNDRFVYEYGIQNFSTCHLSVRLLGGNDNLVGKTQLSTMSRMHEPSDENNSTDSLSDDLSIMSMDSELEESMPPTRKSKSKTKKITLKPPPLKKAKMSKRSEEDNSIYSLSDDSSTTSMSTEETVSVTRLS